MPRKKKSDQPIGVGMTAKQMKRKKPINTDMMREIEPLTDNQRLLYNAYAEDNGEDVDGTLSIEGLIAGLRSDQDGPLGDLNDEEMMLYFEEIGLEIVDDHIDFYEFKKFVTSMIDNSVDEGEGED